MHLSEDFGDVDTEGLFAGATVMGIRVFRVGFWFGLGIGFAHLKII